MRHSMLVPIVTVFVFVMRDSCKKSNVQKKRKSKEKEKKERRNLHTTDQTTMGEC